MRAKLPHKVCTNYIGIDFECDISGDIHIPVFAAVVWCCKLCIDIPHSQSRYCSGCGIPCDNCSEKSLCMGDDSCGLRVKTFRGRKTAEDVGHWLFCKENKGFTIFAHNASGYDGYFLLNHLTEQGLAPRVIFRGSKLLQTHLRQTYNIRVIDTLSFLPMRLSDMPKAFNLQAKSKGHFPHFYFGSDKYIGPMPPANCYGPDQMRKRDRDDFFKWYNQQVRLGTVFDYQKDIETYCLQDSFIMFEAAMKFRHEILDITRRDEEQDGCDPWTYTTLPSLCQAIFKAKFLPEYYDVLLSDQREVKGIKKHGKLYVIEDDGVEVDSVDCDVEKTTFLNSPIIILPPGGLTGHDTFSRSSIEWLEWIARSQNIPIRHALNGGEHKVLNSDGTSYLHLDGYHLDHQSGIETCFSFHGCIWHGCVRCFPVMREARQTDEEKGQDTGPAEWRRISHPYTGQSMSELHALTTMRKKFLKSKGFRVIEMWECQWREMKGESKSIYDFAAGLKYVERLNPKDAFFGGRVNSTKFIYETGDDEKVHYLDFCSLYPFILKTRPMPIFTPRVITEDFASLDQYFGLAKVKVLPPTNLYIPVLPLRLKSKLLFPLCYNCALNLRQDQCRCTDAKRAIIGTWATPELVVAEEKGYIIQEVYEVYHFDEVSQYDQDTRMGGLFAAYINEFLKLKTESSGWPAWCVDSPDLQKQYVSDYEAREGIKLNPANIEINPARRTLAKLALNSLWGRFAMREDYGINTLISSDDEYFDLICNPSHELKNFNVINERILHTEHRKRDGMELPTGSTNIFVAIFTTMFARLHLFSILDKLQERVLYFDTDSVIFSSTDGQWNPPVGDYLGDLQSELQPNEYITKFGAGGPKNYTYQTNLGSTVCKVRGFTLNYENSQVVNFESMIKLIKESLISPDANPYLVTTTPSKIFRKKKDYTIGSRSENKIYSMEYAKRVRLPDSYDTVPYGYHS